MLARVSSLWQPAAVGVVRRFGDHMNRMVLAAAFLTSTSSLAFSSFRSEVPNGASNSCQTCHTRAGGGSPWNSFGNALITSNGGEADNSGSVDAFAAAFIWWDQSLCNADSDGDGQTNGQELGDPDCIWTGGAAARSTDEQRPSVPAKSSHDMTPAPAMAKAKIKARPLKRSKRFTWFPPSNGRLSRDAPRRRPW